MKDVENGIWIGDTLAFSLSFYATDSSAVIALFDSTDLCECDLRSKGLPRQLQECYEDYEEEFSIAYLSCPKAKLIDRLDQMGYTYQNSLDLIEYLINGLIEEQGKYLVPDLHGIYDEK